jgi:hypothetical protein
MNDYKFGWNKDTKKILLFSCTFVYGVLSMFNPELLHLL